MYKILHQYINFPDYLKGGDMKRILFISCVFFALAISANAGELYRCIDSTGNSVFTDSPQDGMRDCVLEEAYEQPSSEETAGEKGKVVEKDKVVEREKVTPEAKVKRINDCIGCCNDRIMGCYNYTADSRLCTAENQNCAAMCKSEGSAPSSWSDCWSQSKK
jgi:hypothetical protein